MRICSHLALALLLGGCGGDLNIVSGLDSDARATIVAVQGPDGLFLEAIESQAFRYQVQTTEALQVTLLHYRTSLAELGLPPGRLVIAKGPLSGLTLPPPDKIQVADSGQTAFEVASSLPEALVGLEFVVPSIAECARGGGCQVERKADGVEICSTPCPDPSIPAPPVEASPPVLTPCPSGWVTIAPQNEGDVDECAPWQTAQTCPTDQMQVPGEGECNPIGGLCGPDGWPEELPNSGSVYFVRANAGAGGSGTRASPFGSLSAIPTTDTGTVVIALAPGSYAAPASWPARVDIRGSCTSEVTMQGGLRVFAQAMRVQDVKIEAPVRLARGASLRLQGVHVLGQQSPLVVVQGSRLDLDRVLVQGSPGTLVQATGEALMTVRHSRLQGAGLSLNGSSEGVFEDVSVHGALVAINVATASFATLGRVALIDSQSLALRSSGIGSRIEMQDVIADSTSPSSDATFGVINGSSLDGQRVRISGAKTLGLSIEKAEATISDLVIRDTGPDPVDLGSAIALQLRDGADVTLRRALLARSAGQGLATRDPLTRLFATDLSIVDTQNRRSDGELGTGVAVVDHSEFIANRVHILRSRGLGFFVDGGGVMTGSDIFVQEVLPRTSNQAYGRGAEISDGAQVELTRVKIDRAKNVGFLALDRGTKVTLFDLSVTGTERSECFDFSCNTAIADGIISMLEASIDVQRFLIADNLQYGLRVVNRSRLHMEDGRVSGHPIGAQIIVDDFNLLEITRNVTFSDNLEAFSFLAR